MPDASAETTSAVICLLEPEPDRLDERSLLLVEEPELPEVPDVPELPDDPEVPDIPDDPELPDPEVEPEEPPERLVSPDVPELVCAPATAAASMRLRSAVLVFMMSPSQLR